MAGSHALLKLELLVLVAIGGFAGSNLRYFVGLLLPGLGGTLVVNVLGSFVLGFLLYEAIHAGLISERTHVVVGTGFLSSFTTYSTFAVQSVQSAPGVLLGNVVVTYALGFGGVLVGRSLAQLVEEGER